MNKLTVIQLLNKIANGENIKNIKYKNHIYKYYNGDFREEIDGGYDSNWLFANEIIDLSNLNDEIEIIEDTPKKIERTNLEVKLDKYIGCWKNLNSLFIGIVTLNEKLNEIIDYINKED